MLRAGMALCALALIACDPGEVEPMPDADTGGTCNDPRLHDGYCQLDIPCGVPDIDCFVIFPTDQEAAVWAVSRTRTAPLGFSDPLYLRGRRLVDRAWQMFRDNVQLGEVGGIRMGLAVMDDRTINAYVLGDGEPGKMGASVQITRGMLESTLSDDAIIGVLLHEITHLVNLHANIPIAAKTRKFYVAYPTSADEPIGGLEPDDADARASAIAWRQQGALNGTLTAPEYGALPLAGMFSNLWDNYTWTVYALYPECTDAINQVLVVRAHLPTAQLDEVLQLKDKYVDDIAAALGGARTCLAADPRTLRDVLTDLGPDWTDEVMSRLTGPEQALLDVHAPEAITELILTRRKKQYEIELDFTAKTGAPWSALRFYSIEEMADDFSIRLSAQYQLSQIGVTDTMYALLEGAAPACNAALAAGHVPYGKNLLDDHHAQCWRIQHARQLSQSQAMTGAKLQLPRPTGEAWTPTEWIVPTPIY